MALFPLLLSRVPDLIKVLNTARLGLNFLEEHGVSTKAIADLLATATKEQRDITAEEVNAVIEKARKSIDKLQEEIDKRRNG